MMAKQLDQNTLLGLVKSDLDGNPHKVDTAKAEFMTELKTRVEVPRHSSIYSAACHPEWRVCRS